MEIVMNRLSRRMFLSILIAFALAFLEIFGLLTTVSAGGEGHHSHENSGHMQAMVAVKDLIPEEYKIMNRSPVRPTSVSVNRGQEIFSEFCSVCHGKDGRGNGPAANSLKTKPANFHDKEHSSIYGPGEKYWIIANGVNTTEMPGFPSLSPEERWHLVNFIISLQK